MQSIRKQASSNTQVVAKALVALKQDLNLTNDTIAKVIGVDPATVSRILKNGDMQENRVYEASVILISIYRSLYALLGGTFDAMQHWLQTANADFARKSPIEEMQTLVGLVEVNQYLNALRGRA